MKKILVCFASGCLGALVNSLAVWQGGKLGIAHWAGVAIAPGLSAAWLYPRIVWGGLWGLFFLIPVLKSRYLLKATLLSFLPTAAQLFYFFPHQAHQGFLGMNLGLWTPAFVVVYNWVWGVVTAVTIRFSR